MIVKEKRVFMRNALGGSSRAVDAWNQTSNDHKKWIQDFIRKELKNTST
jgi:hypothetical protein